MKAEIICVGTELLLGDIVNTNAQFLSRELAALGIDVYYQSVVGDNAARLAEVAALGKARSDLLVFTGGLGPTDDDLTKETIAAVFGDTLVCCDATLARIESFFTGLSGGKGAAMPENNYKQALLPQKGRAIPNANGTAPGAIFIDDGKYAVLLPGPPRECVPMFQSEVRDWLQSLSNAALYSINLRACGVGESRLEEMIAPFLAGQNPTVALYAKTGEVVIRVTAKAATREEAKNLCTACCGEVYRVLGGIIYDVGENGIEHSVVRLLKEQNATIATAESCTGGIISARSTAVPGASEVFRYGACTYANEVKAAVLHVQEDTLRQYGAVSAQTAAEMAQGVQIAAGSTYGLAVTGIAGPGGGTAEKPVGLVYIAICDSKTVYVQQMLLLGRARQTVRDNAAQCALNMARRLASGLDLPDCTQMKREVHHE